MKIKIKIEGHMNHTITGFCNMDGLDRTDSESDPIVS